MKGALQKRLRDINRRLQQISASPQNATQSDEFLSLFQEKQRVEETIRSNSSRREPIEVSLKGQPKVDPNSGSMLANINCELSKLEKRDWELWWIVSVTGTIVAAGLLAVLLPSAFLKAGSLHFEITVPRELVVGLMVLLILLNTYLVSRRIELRRLRERVISGTINNELVRLQSFTDPLTEVYNRRSLEDLTNRYISHARRLQKPLTFMLIDVDRFKQVNTRFGHLTGDFVLAEIANLLRTSVRGCDAVIRYGGDEFLTILADASVTDAERVLERIQFYLNDWNDSAHLEDCAIGLSIGIAGWTDGKTLDEVLDQADQNMYAVKAERASGHEKARAATESS